MNATTDNKVKPIWRWSFAAVSLAIAANEIGGYIVARSININYFNNPNVPISVLDIVAVMVSVYLMAIAIFGRWRLKFKQF